MIDFYAGNLHTVRHIEFNLKDSVLISGVSQFVMAAVTFMNHVELPRVPVLIFVNDVPFDALFFCLNQILISILPLKRAIRQVPASLKS